MAEFSETTTFKVSCPSCHSDRIVKVGKRNGQQRYLCRGCSKKFRANGMPEGGRVLAEQVGMAVRNVLQWDVLQADRRDRSGRLQHPEPSKSTIYEWVKEVHRPGRQGNEESSGPSRGYLGGGRNDGKGGRGEILELESGRRENPLYPCQLLEQKQRHQAAKAMLRRAKAIPPSRRKKSRPINGGPTSRPFRTSSRTPSTSNRRDCRPNLTTI